MSDHPAEDLATQVSDPVAAAVDRLAQVLDHHAARIFDQLQAIADRLCEQHARKDPR